MKTTQRFLAATVLTAVLAVSTFAGDMHTPSITPLPPPPPPVPGERHTTPSRMADDSSSETTNTYDLLTETALLFYNHVLAIL